MHSPVPAPLTAGTAAPDFSLPATSGSAIALGDFRNTRHVLLAFFPEAFTSVCTSEMCAFSDDYDAFSDLDVEVLPISMDTIETLNRFRNERALRVHLLSDVGGVVARQYGALWKNEKVANRAYFLIDKTGVIRWAHAEEHPGLRRENVEILQHITNVTR